MAVGDKRKLPINYGLSNNGRYGRCLRPLPDRLFGDMFLPDSGQPPPPLPQNKPSTSSSLKPRSQREATMAVQPTQEDIGTVTSFTGCDDNTAARYLKAKHNNVEAAVNALFDGEDIFASEKATQWDDGIFAADREGNRDDGASRNLRPLTSSAAPTRGPSPAGSYRQPTSREEEDEELQRAIANSQGLPYQQESGTIGKDGKEVAYGPQNKTHNPNDWALVTFSRSATSEVVPDVAPEERKSVPGEPRFLKPLPNGDYLPNFITICHSIPAAREALLMRHGARSDYGSDAEWWKGHRIVLPRIVHIADGSPADDDADRYEEFVAETQRLMAFLDSSDRSYASANALVTTNALKDHVPHALVDRFIKEMRQAVAVSGGDSDAISCLFSTSVIDNSETASYDVVDLPVDVIDNGKDTSLCERLDNLIWGSQVTDTDDGVKYIESLAQVVSVQVRKSNIGPGELKLDVPTTLSLHKYMKENVPMAKGLRTEIAEKRKKIALIEKVERNLTTHVSATGKQLDPKALLTHARDVFLRPGVNKGDAGDQEDSSMVNGVDENRAKTARQLEALMESVDKKLAEIRLLKEKTQEALSQLSGRETVAPISSNHQRRYTLWGVATKPSTTYMLRPISSEEDPDTPMSEGSEADTQTPEGLQWWRIEYYASGSSTMVHKAKYSAAEVLRAIKAEHDSVLLVYANDAALDEEHIGQALPSSLEAFVKSDNELFATELEDSLQQSGQPPPYELAGGNIPRQSIEGRASSDSLRAQLSDTSEMLELPELEDVENDNGLRQHHSYGLGYDSKPRAQGMEMEDLPLVEIAEPTGSEDMGVQMVEKPHVPLVPGLRSDAVMDDVDDTAETGHIEHLRDFTHGKRK